MKYPSWEDVSVPHDLVNSIKMLPSCYMIDSLVHQLVFRGKRKATYVYHCHCCGNLWKPERISDEVVSCWKCNDYQVSCQPQLRFGKEIPAYSKRIHHLTDVVNYMRENYRNYFGKLPPEPFVDVGWLDAHWSNVNVYAAFPGGERIEGVSPKMCLFYAAISCPYLWDNAFNWTEGSRSDTMNVEHIGPILYNFCHPQWLGRPE